MRTGSKSVLSTGRKPATLSIEIEHRRGMCRALIIRIVIYKLAYSVLSRES